MWKDEGRWEHDKFREDEQAPKSRQELITLAVSYEHPLSSEILMISETPKNQETLGEDIFGAYIIDICKEKKKNSAFKKKCHSGP